MAELFEVKVLSNLTWPSPRRCSQNTFDRPASPITFGNCTLANRNNFAPFTNTMCLIIPGQKHGIARIAGLPCPRSPYAVFRAIRPVIVQSFQRMLGGWTWPHIMQKGRKRVLPTLTNANATTTPSGIIFACRAIASLFHFTPGTVFWTDLVLSCSSMRNFQFQLQFSHQTSTTTRSFVTKTHGRNRDDSATDTLAYPMGSPTRNRRTCITFEHSKPLKSLPGQVKKVDGRLFAQTSTTACLFFAKLIRAYRDNLSTNTLTYPPCFVRRAMRLRVTPQHSKSVKGFPCQIDQRTLWHQIPPHSGYRLTGRDGIAASVSSCLSGRDSLAIPPPRSIAFWGRKVY